MEDESQAPPRGFHGEIPQPEQDIQEQVSRRAVPQEQASGRNMVGRIFRNGRVVGTWLAGYSGTGEWWEPGRKDIQEWASCRNIASWFLSRNVQVVGTRLAGSSGTGEW